MGAAEADGRRKRRLEFVDDLCWQPYELLTKAPEDTEIQQCKSAMSVSPMMEWRLGGAWVPVLLETFARRWAGPRGLELAG